MENPKCCICNRECENEYGNNAQPIKEGRCCDDCNDRKVIPVRIDSYLKSRKRNIEQNPEQRRRNQVISSGNKWAIENWNATHNEKLKI